MVDKPKLFHYLLDKFLGIQMKTKDTTGKPKLSLVPYKTLADISFVREFGDNKYEPGSWAHTKPEEMVDAALRHIYRHLNGDDRDPESGLSHLSHAITSLIIANENYYHKKDTIS